MQGMLLVLTERAPHRRQEFKENGEADLSYALPGVARFRVNIFRERGNTAMTLRNIPQEVPELTKLGVPKVIGSMALESHGLVLVTGATGSGKTTTLAAMIDHINRTKQAHILTIEDPIEIVHPNHKSLISQREVGMDTADFKQALRRALRQDPDVILIGEIRDEETMRTALAAAETGHLVLATLHTINAQETIARVLDLFPADAEKQARAMLAGALKGIISQRLARTTDGGRVAVVEVLVNTARIADCILNPEETGKITEALERGEYYGMQTFDQCLIGLIAEGRVAEDDAMHHVSSPQNFKLMLESTRAQYGMDGRVFGQPIPAPEVVVAADPILDAAAAAQVPSVPTAEAPVYMEAPQVPVPVPVANPEQPAVAAPVAPADPQVAAPSPIPVPAPAPAVEQPTFVPTAAAQAAPPQAVPADLHAMAPVPIPSAAPTPPPPVPMPQEPQQAAPTAQPVNDPVAVSAPAASPALPGPPPPPAQ
jgi:twitching motility protein PilT